MKKLNFLGTIIFALLLLQSCIVSRSPNVGYFDNANEDFEGARFTSINVPMFLAKPIVKKALSEDGESEELVNLIRKVSDIKVMTIENGNEKMVSNFAKYLINNNFEEWMTIKKEKEIIKFQAKQKGDVIKKLMITIASGDELVLVDVSGKFSPDDISRIINYSEKKDVRKIISK